MRGWKRGGKASEAEIELQILDYFVRVRKLFAWKNPTAGYYDTKLKRFRRQMNPYAINGAPDIILVYLGHFIGFEVKREGGRQSESQKEFERRLRMASGYYFIVHSLEEAIEALDSIQVMEVNV